MASGVEVVTSAKGTGEAATTVVEPATGMMSPSTSAVHRTSITSRERAEANIRLAISAYEEILSTEMTYPARVLIVSLYERVKGCLRGAPLDVFPLSPSSERTLDGSGSEYLYHPPHLFEDVQSFRSSLPIRESELASVLGSLQSLPPLSETEMLAAMDPTHAMVIPDELKPYLTNLRFLMATVRDWIINYVCKYYLDPTTGALYPTIREPLEAVNRRVNGEAPLDIDCIFNFSLLSKWSITFFKELFRGAELNFLSYLSFLLIQNLDKKFPVRPIASTEPNTFKVSLAKIFNDYLQSDAFAKLVMINLSSTSAYPIFYEMESGVNNAAFDFFEGTISAEYDKQKRASLSVDHYDLLFVAINKLYTLFQTNINFLNQNLAIRDFIPRLLTVLIPSALLPENLNNPEFAKKFHKFCFKIVESYTVLRSSQTSFSWDDLQSAYMNFKTTLLDFFAGQAARIPAIETCCDEYLYMLLVHRKVSDPEESEEASLGKIASCAEFNESERRLARNFIKQINQLSFFLLVDSALLNGPFYQSHREIIPAIDHNKNPLITLSNLQILIEALFRARGCVADIKVKSHTPPDGASAGTISFWIDSIAPKGGAEYNGLTLHIAGPIDVTYLAQGELIRITHMGVREAVARSPFIKAFLRDHWLVNNIFKDFNIEKFKALALLSERIKSQSAPEENPYIFLMLSEIVVNGIINGKSGEEVYNALSPHFAIDNKEAFVASIEYCKALFQKLEAIPIEAASGRTVLPYSNTAEYGLLLYLKYLMHIAANCIKAGHTFPGQKEQLFRTVKEVNDYLSLLEKHGARPTKPSEILVVDPRRDSRAASTAGTPTHRASRSSWGSLVSALTTTADRSELGAARRSSWLSGGGIGHSYLSSRRSSAGAPPTSAAARTVSSPAPSLVPTAGELPPVRAHSDGEAAGTARRDLTAVLEAVPSTDAPAVTTGGGHAVPPPPALAFKKPPAAPPRTEGPGSTTPVLDTLTGGSGSTDPTTAVTGVKKTP